MTRAAISPLVALVLVGCSSPQARHPSEDDPRVSLPANWTACTTDADCVALEMGCCDHCNGGWVLAVERGHEAQTRETYGAKCTGGEVKNPDGSTSFSGSTCTELGCGGIRGECASGSCVWAWDAKLDGDYVRQPNKLLLHRI